MQVLPQACRPQRTGRNTNICHFPHPCPIPLLLSLPAQWERWHFWCSFNCSPARCSLPCEGIEAPDYCQALKHVQKNYSAVCEPAQHWKRCCLPRVAEPAAALLFRGGCAGQAGNSHPFILLRIFLTNFCCNMCANGSGLGSAGCEELLWPFLLPISTILSKHRVVWGISSHTEQWRVL